MTNELTTTNHATYHLSPFSVLSIDGPDATSFLQGQLSNNVEQPNEHALPIGFCCARQGRVIGWFFFLPAANGYWLLMPQSMIDLMQRRLKKYQLQSRVVFTTFTPTLWDLPSEVAINAQTRLPISPWSRQLCINPSKKSMLSLTQSQAPFHQWHRNLLAQGLPLMSPTIANRFLPHDLGWQDLNLVDLKKGCYVGQEIIARMHYLGKRKQQMLLWESTQTYLPGETLNDDLNRAYAQVVDCAPYPEQHTHHVLGIVKQHEKDRLQGRILKCFSTDA